jgi:hypothetical protein
MLEKLRWLAPLRRKPDQTKDRWYTNLIGKPCPQDEGRPGAAAMQPWLTPPIQVINPVVSISYPPAICTFYRRPATLGRWTPFGDRQNRECGEASDGPTH